MVGRILFFLSWPILWFVMPLTRRVRVIVLYDNQVLLIKNWIGNGKWDLPGGGVKFGESADDAAIRELREELGMHVRDIRKLHAMPMTMKRSGITQRLEYLLATTDPDENVIQNWEITAFSWRPLSEALTLDIIPKELETLIVSSDSMMQDDTL